MKRSEARKENDPTDFKDTREVMALKGIGKRTCCQCFLNVISGAGECDEKIHVIQTLRQRFLSYHSLSI